MAQTTVLASAQTAAVSSDITVAAGASVLVGLIASAAIPAPVVLTIRAATPGKDMLVGKLSQAHPTAKLDGPGTFRVYRPLITAYGVNVGAFTDDGGDGV